MKISIALSFIFVYKKKKMFAKVKRALCNHGWIYATHTDLYDEIK